MPEATLPLRQPLLYLLVTQGPWTGTLIPMKTTQFLIGRGPHCHLRPTCTQVEDYHCNIVSADDRFFLCDRKSLTGTFLNDRQIFGKVELLDQDCLRVGPLQFRVKISNHLSSAAADATDGSSARFENIVNG
jgi:predicted component of type VI protein secretion system